MGDHTRRGVLGGIVVGLSGCSDLSGGGEPTDAESPTEREPRNTFYVENRDDTSYCFELTVETVGGDVTPIDGQYDVPALEGITYGRVGVYESEYQVTFEADAGPQVDDVWQVRLCGNETSPRAEDGRAAAVRIEGGEASLVANECDAIAVGSHPQGYLAASNVDQC